MAASFTQDDFRRIRLSLAAAILMAAAGGAAVFGAAQLLQAEMKDNAAATARRTEIQGRLARARDEELELKKKIARFNELAGRGIFGLEQRLDWIEQIRQIKHDRKLLDLQYEIAPQQPIEAALLPGGSAGFDFLSSSMQLKMQLLHEEDLLNFLADLRATVPAFLRVRKCNVERLPKSAGEARGTAPQLAAECTIDWITVRERKAA
jgi:hypothetical protein